MDKNQFSALEKTSAKSFHDQKALIKKVMSGQQINCKQCGGVIQLILPEDKKPTGLYCQKGCTNIALDFS
jgi:hypothetical protein